MTDRRGKGRKEGKKKDAGSRWGTADPGNRDAAEARQGHEGESGWMMGWKEDG